MNLKISYIIIALLLAFDNVFIRFRVGGIISIDRLLEFIFFFVLFKPYLQALNKNVFFRRWNRFLLAFIVLQVVVDLRLLFLNEIDMKYFFVDVFKGVSFIVFSALFFLTAQKDLRYVNIILIGHFLICVFSILQHPLSPIASQMLDIKRTLLSAPIESKISGKLDTESTYILGGYADRFRMAGPFSSTISFSYFAISSFLISFYMYLKTKKRIYIIFLGLVFICSIFSQTRSLILGELIVVAGYFFVAPQRKRPLYQLAFIAFGLIFSLFIVVGQEYLMPENSRLTKLNPGGQSDSRPILWLTGLVAVVSHPFGVSDKEYESVKEDMYFKYGHGAVLHLPSHHGLINLGMYYSLLGYVLLFMFIKFLIEHNKNSIPVMKVFFLLCLVGYVVHISFHNNVVLLSDYPFLLVLMLMGMESQGLLSVDKQVSQKLYNHNKKNSSIYDDTDQRRI